MFPEPRANPEIVDPVFLIILFPSLHKQKTGETEKERRERENEKEEDEKRGRGTVIWNSWPGVYFSFSLH